jgi:hypothetical protein
VQIEILIIVISQSVHNTGLRLGYEGKSVTHMKKINPKKIIYILFGIIVMAYIIFKFCLELWGNYTVCKIDEIVTVKGGTKVSYSFYYKGEKKNW